MFTGFHGCPFVLSHHAPQNEFWIEMTKTQPSMARLNVIGTAIEQASKKCELCFHKQLALFPNSAPTLRRYAQFLIEVRLLQPIVCGLLQQTD